MEGISVIVCCYNSASRIRLTLDYLARQKTSENLLWEIVLVDNNSADDTVTVAENASSIFNTQVRFRIIHEAKAGLSNARETGVKASAYDLIVFCDDDNLLEEDYVQKAFNIVKETRKEGFGIWGGMPVEYFDHTEIPEWFEAEKANYVVGRQGYSTGDISDRGYVWGAGMIILKDLFLAVANKKVPLLLTGRKSGILSAGDDSEISARSLILGYKLYYNEGLVLKHYIPKDKLTQEYNARLVQGFSHAQPLLNKYNVFIHYISGRSFLQRLYYSFAFSVKCLLSLLHIRPLTTHDNTVIHALFPKKFNDRDFALMWELLKLRTRHSTKNTF